MKVFHYAALLCSFAVFTIVTGLHNEVGLRNLRGLNEQLDIVNVEERLLVVAGVDDDEVEEVVGVSYFGSDSLPSKI